MRFEGNFGNHDYFAIMTHEGEMYGSIFIPLKRDMTLAFEGMELRIKKPFMWGGFLKMIEHGAGLPKLVIDHLLGCQKGFIPAVSRERGTLAYKFDERALKLSSGEVSREALLSAFIRL